MATGDLTTLAAVKASLNLTSSAQDTQLGSLITAISTFIVTELGRGILTATYTEVRTGNGKSSMMLKNWPVKSITKVEWPAGSIAVAGDQFLGTPGIDHDDRNLILVGYALEYGAPIRITYSAGYDVVPADISLVVAELVAEAYSQAGHRGETSHSTNGTTTVSFDTKAMHAAIERRLFNYQAVAPLC